MKSRVLFLLAIMAGCVNMSAQNLVPNGSFEEGSECPMFLDDLHFRCNDWYKSIQVPGVPMNENPSPDWYHACSENDQLSTPNFVFGYQQPYEGSGLAALICYDAVSFNSREVMGVQLIEPLQIGEIYTISFNLVAETQAVSTGLLVNKLGFKLTSYEIFESVEDAVDNFAHGYIEEIIEDTLEWSAHSFELTADSTYTFIHFGLFFTNDQVDTLFQGDGGPQHAYYLFDNISLVEGSLLSTTDKLGYNDLVIAPNPTSNSIIILQPEIPEIFGSKYQIFSLNGLEGNSGILYDNSINLSTLHKGLYILKIHFENGKSLFQKITKI